MALYSYDYDTAISPSAPILPIEVEGANQKPQKISALVDSGADATMLPITLLEEVAAEEVETRFLRGVTGRRTVVDL